MAVRPIVLYKNNPEALRKKSQPVQAVDRRTRRLIRDLKDTLCDGADGLGLAAPQINVHDRVVIVRLGGGRGERNPDPPIALVNPKILEAGDVQRDFDGCLSFPDLYGDTSRPHFLRVTGLDENGETFDRTFAGFDAVIVHHEMDHLDGILFIDRVETKDDLYFIAEDENGENVRVPIDENSASFIPSPPQGPQGERAG
jgi:peptide deformylase